ncbi:DUF2256 domain-containing protein [Marinomonas posidonica]|uniref:DUF2256 domain-containing protein n=1 Tax=Marinomonas posidonica TaxID=936476 RepID=UPI0037361190
MAHKKPHLPEKICLACQRPFTWRKKWERDWQHVKYCSVRCKKQGAKPTLNTNNELPTKMTPSCACGLLYVQQSKY